MNFETHSDDETRAVGHELASVLPQRGVVLLIGELGVGKTTLTKGIVEGRGVASPDDVSSPTFPLIHEYGQPVRIYHIDLYRLETAAEVLRLGLEELFDAPALVLIEWGERFPDLWPAGTLAIRIAHRGGDDRSLEVGLFQPDLAVALN